MASIDVSNFNKNNIINKLDTNPMKPSYRICCAPGCRSNFTIDSVPVQTFPFPQDKILKKKWLFAVKADLRIKLIAPQICIKHFEDHFLLRQVEIQSSGNDTIIYPNGKVELADNAVPTIFFNEQSLPFAVKKETNTEMNDIQCTYSKIEQTQNFCRICLATNIRLISLATVRNISSNAIEIENNEIGNLFEHLFAIRTSDLPTWLKICFLCQNQLQNFYEFQRNAIQEHKNLMEIAKNPKLMEKICKNSQEKFVTNNDEMLNKNCNENDDNFIEDEWNEQNMDVYEDTYLSDNEIETCENSETTSSFNLNEQMIEYLEPAFDNLSCSICSKEFNSKINFDLHMKDHDENQYGQSSNITKESNIYKCECCYKEFVDKESATNHYKQYCDNILGRCLIKCENCEETFNSKNGFNRHKVLCGKSVYKKYFKCQLCAQTFCREKLFKNHLQLHHGIYQNSQCSICYEDIYINYNEHMKQKHGISVLKDSVLTDCYDEEVLENGNDVTCQLCDTIYGTNELLQKHLYHDHLIQYKFKCPTCSISFQNETYLKNHIKDHKNPDRQSFLNDINKQIVTSKNLYLKKRILNLSSTGGDHTIPYHHNNITTKSNEGKYIMIQNVKDVINEEYEIISEQLNSPCSSEKNESNTLDKALIKHKKKIVYIEDDNFISDQKRNNQDSLSNEYDEEENFFEIDIKPYNF